MHIPLIIGGVIAGWLGLALLSMLPGHIPTAAIPHGTPLPSNVSVIGTTKHLLIVRSDDTNYVRALYASGAKFVLPARKKTCLDLQ